jgi:hypothetical protein
MASEQHPRLPEEELRGINQITNPEEARASADIEKPIRDLARDPRANPDIRRLKPLLDQEAERIAADTSRVKEELLHLPISVIPMSNRNRRIFEDCATKMDIKTIGDLLDLMRAGNYYKVTISQRGHLQVQEWLMSHGLLP